MARRSKFTPAQIHRILLEASVYGIAPTARRYGNTPRDFRRKSRGDPEKTILHWKENNGKKKTASSNK